MKRLADEFRRRYDTSYVPIDVHPEISLIDRKSLDEILITVTMRLFELDSARPKCDWGRVIALVVFTSSLALTCHERGYHQLDIYIREWLVAFLTRNRLVSAWIESIGEWVSFYSNRFISFSFINHSTQVLFFANMKV